MTQFQQIEQLIADLSPEEQAQLASRLLQVLSQSSPGIGHFTGVNGGRATVARTRIPVWTLVEARQNGATDSELLQAFPVLSADDIVNAWNYYWGHKEEIDRDIREQNEA